MPISLGISSSASSLNASQTANITFTFSEPPVGFTLGDVTVSGGTLSAFSDTANPLVYTAVLTPSVGVAAGSAGISVAAGAYANGVGDFGSAASMPTISLDTLAPTVSITSSTSSLRSGETATMTVTFSEGVSGFSLGDLSATGGTLSGLTATANPLVYTVDFTPNGGLSGFLGSVSLSANTYTDLAGNDGGGGSSQAITINTLGPSVLISTSQGALKAGESALLTFTFSSPPVGFAASDIIYSGGTVSGLTNLGGGVYEATFTPSSGVAAGAGNVSVASGSYVDINGNSGGGASITPISIDTLRPTVSMAIADPNLGIGQTTSVTFTFSEAVTGFTLADVVASNATLSGLTTSDNITYAATLTPAAGITDTSNYLTVHMTGLADAGQLRGRHDRFPELRARRAAADGDHRHVGHGPEGRRDLDGDGHLLRGGGRLGQR